MKQHIIHEDGSKVRAKFQFYRDGHLWYKTEAGLTFPIPVEDTGAGTFPRDCDAVVLMRWIRAYFDKVDKHAKVT